MQVFKQIPEIVIAEAKAPKPSFSSKPVMDAFNKIPTCIDHLEELFTQCTKEMCVQFMLATKIGLPKEEIFEQRKILADCFETLSYKSIADLLRINENELAEQDMVDLRRIVQLLIQISAKNRDDAKENLQARFDSLQKLGLNTTTTEPGSLMNFDLPANLKLTIKHSDVQIGRLIGRGQTGVVKLGKLIPTGDIVAVKQLSRTSFSPAEFESFRREVYVLSSLSHPSLLKFFGYTEEAPYLILTEYMSNGSVFECFQKKASELTPTIRSLIALDVAKGLEYLHAKGFIHRDMKSLNVLLDEHFRAKICDFGMARSSGKGGMTGMIGTAHWMAPEVLISSPTYDERVDVYSFGIFLWELLTGAQPYEGMPAIVITQGVVEQNLRPTIPEGTPPRLADLMKRCWADNPERRPMMSKVVSELCQERCHFVGTDEEEFAKAAGIAQTRHKASASMFVHRRGNKESPLEVGSTLVEAIERSQGANKDALINQLFSLLPDKNTAESLASHGACSIISTNLNSEYAMNQLIKCTSPAIFDVSVLKALLQYSTHGDQAVRERALSVLVIGSSLRLDFLSTSPSFLVQLLMFLRRPTESDLANSLIKLTKKLLARFTEVPSGLSSLIIWLKVNYHDLDLNPCLKLLFRIPDTLAQVSKSDMESLLQTDFFDTLDSYDIPDLPRVMLLFADTERGLAVLCKMAKEEAVALKLVKLLPITTKITMLYKVLASHPSCHAALVEQVQFYDAVADLLRSGKYDICVEMRKMKTAPAAFAKSRLAQELVNSLQNADEEAAVLIMGACHSILQTTAIPGISQKLTDLIFGPATELRMPAFLCVCAISKYEATDPRVVYAAAFYANDSSEFAREAASDLIENHIMDEDVDINDVLTMFTNHYSGHKDDIMKRVIIALRRGCDGRDIEGDLLSKMSQIYRTAFN